MMNEFSLTKKKCYAKEVEILGESNRNQNKIKKLIEQDEMKVSEESFFFFEKIFFLKHERLAQKNCLENWKYRERKQGNKN